MPDVQFCVVQTGSWETGYERGDLLTAAPEFQTAKYFQPDVAVFRLGENIRHTGGPESSSPAGLETFLVIFPRRGRTDSQKRLSAKRPAHWTFCSGKSDQMTAKGLFAHDGVVMHPGAQSMKAIARRIFPALIPFLKETSQSNLIVDRHHMD